MTLETALLKAEVHLREQSEAMAGQELARYTKAANVLLEARARLVGFTIDRGGPGQEPPEEGG